MTYIDQLYHSIKNNVQNTCFCINEEKFNYQEFDLLVSQIRTSIQENVLESDKIVGLYAHDDIYTYASIIALWFENKGYVAINSLFPENRNREILSLAGCNILLNSNRALTFETNLLVIETDKLNSTYVNLPPKQVDKTGIAYIIFTSGSTGKPKGVPISFENVDEFAKELEHDEAFSVSSADRCLQMFELTFDMSVVSYLIPLLYGASIYTIPKDKIKYIHIFKLLEQHKLTVLIMVPSIINYLKPYFSEINAPQVRLSCFAGGKSFDDVAIEWNKCIPNAQFINYYGPTETTIYCGYYLYKGPHARKHHNNIISIGKPFKNTAYLIIDDDNNIITDSSVGELAIAGKQVMPGYWKNEEQNKKVFIDKLNRTYYKSGDLCFKDEDGDYMYVGRKDFQVKIGGYRVELGEIEYQTKKIITDKNLVVVDVVSKNGMNEIALVVEGQPFDIQDIKTHLSTILPNYMIPTHFHFLPNFPHNINGKLDRKELRKLIKEQ